MTIRKKSKEELQAQAEGFLEYEKRKGKIDEEKSKELFDILLNKETISASKEQTKEQLVCVLTSEEFDGLYEDYCEWLEKSNKVRKNIIEKILPKEYMFLSNENYLKNYYIDKNFGAEQIERENNKVEKNIGILKKYNIEDKDLKLFIEIIPFSYPETIEENLKLFYDNGITDINDLCLLKDGMTWRSDWKKENIKSLNMLGITKPKDLIKLKKIVFSKNPKSTKINLETLKNVGITNVDDLVELQEIIGAGENKIITSRPRIKRIDTGEHISRCLKFLTENGVVLPNDLKLLKAIILAGKLDNMKMLTDSKINSPSDLKSFENIIIQGRTEILELLKKENIIRNTHDLRLLENIICKGDTGVFSAIINCGVRKIDDLLKIKDIIITGYYKSEEIKGKIEALKESGITEIDDLVKVQSVIISFTEPKNIKRNIQALKESGITEVKDLVKFQDIIKCNSYDISDGRFLFPISSEKKRIKDNIQALKESGVTEIDDLVKFQDVILKYPSSGILRKINGLKEKILVLKDMGIADVDDLLSFDNIIYNYKIEIEKIKKEFDILFYEWKIQLPKELSKFQQAAIYENISQFNEYFGSLKNDEIGDIEMKVLSGIEIPKDLEFKERNHKGYLKFIAEIIDTTYENDKKTKMIKKIVTLGFNEAKKYLEVFKMLDTSISMDVQRVKNELIDEVLESDNPSEVAEQIKNIFEKNNLPLTGKVFKVFELLYPEEKFNGLLKPSSGNGTLGSPVLNDYKDKGKNVYKLIYKDLMNIAIKSGDRSLREYLKIFIGSEDILKKIEGIVGTPGFDPNDEQCLKGIDIVEKEKLRYLFRKIATLSNMFLGKEIKGGNKEDISDKDLLKFYNKIKKGFNLRDGKSIYERIQTLLYVNGLGYHSASEVLEDMDKYKKQAHERGLKFYNESIGEKIDFPKHAFVKGVNEESFSKIINRGIASREYLGGGDDGKNSWNNGGNGAGSDCTPFDIDGYYVDKQTESTYGLVNLVVNTDRGNFVNTTIDENSDGLKGYQENQYELFKTGVVNKNHYGIRTGIPTTEIDYIIYNGSFDKTKESIVKSGSEEGDKIVKFSDFQDLCYEIAKNGYYIPIVDREGNIKFTPDMYHQIRAGFNYMEYYDGYDVEFKDGKYVSRENDNTINKNYDGDNEKIKDSELKELIAENSPTNEKYQKFAKENGKLAREKLQFTKSILEEQCGIEFNSEFDTSILGARLYDSGSTGRGTDIPTKDVDLDFTLLLDADDYDNKLELIKDTIYRVTDTKDTSKGGSRKDSGGHELGYQIKSQGNTLGKSDERPDGIPLDLLILKKSQVIDYSSSDAMKEKLNYIEKNLGAENLDRVRTNVIIMKKLLKAKGCYKKPEGGISGIGVENRITQHHGSFIEALESFEKVAYGGKYEEGKQPKSLEEFKEQYPMYDAGENYKDGCNDNFVYKINKEKNPKAYESMLDIVKVLRTKGIDGIKGLIKEYENKKAKFTQ